MTPATKILISYYITHFKGINPNWPVIFKSVDTGSHPAYYNE